MKESNVIYYNIIDSHKEKALSVMIATKNTRSKPLHYYDSEKEESRALRYADNHKSPFEDEQSGDLLLKPIIFELGKLEVPKSKTNLIKFLDCHPDNEANGGRLFKRRDFEAEHKESIDKIDRKLKAQTIAAGLSGDEYRAIHRQISKYTDRLDAMEIRIDVRRFAESNFDEFLEMIDSDETEKTGFIGSLIDEELVALKQNNTAIYYNLPDKKSLITRVPKGTDPYEYLEEFLSTDDGLEHMQVLEDALSNI